MEYTYIGNGMDTYRERAWGKSWVAKHGQSPPLIFATYALAVNIHKNIDYIYVVNIYVLVLYQYALVLSTVRAS